MFKRLSVRLAIIYTLVFLAALTSIDVLLVFAYKKNQFAKTEAVYHEVAGILSSMVERNIKIAGLISMDNDIYPGSLNGRILYLDGEGRVLSDSLNEFEGELISNREIRSAKDNKVASAGYYDLNGKRMAMFSYPILSEDSSLSGIILISAYIDEVYLEIKRFANQVIMISAVVFLLVFIVSLLAGERITKPIRKLNDASGEILRGKLNVCVAINRSDEIGILAGTFNKMSEELYKIDTGRRRFVSDISHELKTPLTSVKALVESLIEGEPDQETCKEYLKDINSEIDRLSALVRSLLTTARLEEIQIKLQPLNICNEVDSIIKVFTHLAQNARISLHNKCDRDIEALLDRDMFREVLMNLVDNGLKYGRQDGNINIGTIRDSGCIKLFVEDDGIGMNKDDLPNIFDNFYRVDEARTRERGGSGIGLFIVKRISDHHGWILAVWSEPDKGTRFEITLKA